MSSDAAVTAIIMAKLKQHAPQMTHEQHFQECCRVMHAWQTNNRILSKKCSSAVDLLWWSDEALIAEEEEEKKDEEKTTTISKEVLYEKLRKMEPGGVNNKTRGVFCSCGHDEAMEMTIETRRSADEGQTIKYTCKKVGCSNPAVVQNC